MSTEHGRSNKSETINSWCVREYRTWSIHSPIEAPSSAWIERDGQLWSLDEEWPVQLGTLHGSIDRFDCCPSRVQSSTRRVASTIFLKKFILKISILFFFKFFLFLYHHTNKVSARGHHFWFSVLPALFYSLVFIVLGFKCLERPKYKNACRFRLWNWLRCKPN